MDSSSTTAESQQSYPFPSIPAWTNPSPRAATASSATAPTTATPNSHPTTRPTSASVSSSKANSTATSTPSTPYAPHLDGSTDVAGATSPGAGQYPSHVDLLPYFQWFPHQSSVYNAQLLHYNKLISPTRGGGGGLQAAPLPPVVSASNAQAGPRSRSSSKVSLKDASSGKGSTVGGHGSRKHHPSDKARSVITPKEAQSSKMARQQQAQDKAGDQSKTNTRKGGTAATPAQAKNSHSSSVPSTPHQRARHFSLESRDPSPNEPATNHSPRSVYSETNSAVPSLKPLNTQGCKYETAQVNSRRRIPYSIGDDKLESVELGKIKGKLTPEEEKKVASDMVEIYAKLKPSAEVEDKRMQLVRKLEKLFNDEWPGHDIKAHLFGSSGNLLCSDDSDVDICITTPWREMEHVCMIADLLAQRGMEKVVCISKAKVPIVKIWDPELGMACDMNVNNTTALENTRMIRTYVEADPRVRQLMMVIKYWTRRRVINDAALGGTLSSYTWICMIIAFLQLRTPPVSPTLHALPYKKPRPNGEISEFADNLKKLKGIGEANPSSTADLLFQFFRFYAFELNYDKYVLSVRSGTLMTKTEKGWTSGNNQLCVEEPFNPKRNLGNTADAYAFKGLHMELRRAFDLISQAKFKEACEQFEFPKEEERPTFRRPQAASKPVMVRSASQTNTSGGSGAGRGGRSNHRGGRHSFRGGNGGSNRRASSSAPTYDNMNLYGNPMHVQQDLSAWYGNPMFYYSTNGEVLNQMGYPHDPRQAMQMYAHNAVYAQQHPMGHTMLAPASNTAQPQSAERSRTNSFDNQPAPLTAPLRPELFAMYGMAALSSPLFQQNGSSYPSYVTSPTATNGYGHEFRRPLQRSGAGADKGAPASSSSLRSQSQPATRSPMQAAVAGGQPAIANSQSAANVPSVGASDPNGVPIPSFSNGTDFDETPKASMMSPNSDSVPQGHYFATGNSTPPQESQYGAATYINGGATATVAQTPEASTNTRRLSTEQLPQSILDRRMRRTSRSPSPLGHSRAASIGTAPAPAPEPAADSRPLVVNGSGLMATRSANARVGPAGENMTSQTSPPMVENTATAQPSVPHAGPPLYPDQLYPVMGGPPPVVANGAKQWSSNVPTNDSSFRERVALMNSTYMNMPHFAQHPSFTSNGHYTPAMRQQIASQQPQNAVIAPLDLAISNEHVRKPAETDASLLSPVYETLTPSPTTNRKPDFATSPQPSQQQAWSSALKQNLRAEELAGSPQAGPGSQPNQRTPPSQLPHEAKQGKSSKSVQSKPNGTKENGHARDARGEAESGWQKAGKGKKKGNTAQTGGSEQPPKNALERKGG